MDNLTELEIDNLFVMDYHTEDSIELTNTINKAVEKANYVYTYQRYKRIIEEEPDIIKWIKNNAQKKFKKVEINYLEYNRVEICKSNNIKERKVYLLNLNEGNNREKFKSMLKISFACVRNFLNESQKKSYKANKMCVEDPVYDLYDFIFTLDNKVLLITDIHAFFFEVNRDLN